MWDETRKAINVKLGSVERKDAFTLIELLAVIGIIGVFIAVIGLSFIGGGNQTVGLQSAQANLVSLLTLVRGQAAITGRDAAILVNVDRGNPDRYLRFIVPVIASDEGSWDPVSEGTFLVRGSYVVPLSISEALIEPGVEWENSQGRELVSLGNGLNEINEAILSDQSEEWLELRFYPNGTTSAPTTFVVAAGRTQSPGTEYPILLVNPAGVRGVIITNGGLIRTIQDAESFPPSS